ncbi:hypothetical protein IWGMT90018_16860 [Mycobacterium kiyosense]|nr:hypothetical protein IWGMT90018_16860 [Mycobacterium kiyosense]
MIGTLAVASTRARSGTTLSETHGPKMTRHPLLDQFVEGTRDRLIGAVRQPDDVALDKLDRAVDQVRRERFFHHQLQCGDGVVVHGATGRIIIEQSDFHRGPPTHTREGRRLP